jgi:hypothetical protein
MLKYFPFGGSGGGVVYWHLGCARPTQHGKTFPLGYNMGMYNQGHQPLFFIANLYMIHYLQILVNAYDYPIFGGFRLIFILIDYMKLKEYKYIHMMNEVLTFVP